MVIKIETKYNKEHDIYSGLNKIMQKADTQEHESIHQVPITIKYIQEHNASIGLNRIMQHVDLYGADIIRRQQRIEYQQNINQRNALHGLDILSKQIEKYTEGLNN